MTDAERSITSRFGRFPIFVALIAIIVVAGLFFAFESRNAVYVVSSMTVYENGAPQAVHVYERDRHGNVERTVIESNGTVAATTHTYDKYGAPTKAVGADALGNELVTLYENTYGAKHRVAHIEATQADGVALSYDFEYYDNGILKSVTQTFSDDVFVTRTYNEAGWCTRAAYSDGKTVDYAIETNENGRVIRVIPSDTHDLYTFAYDDNENIVAVIRNDQVVYTCEYQRVRRPSNYVKAQSGIKQL